jgi:cellulose synthase/poly-beta-1,6-N-acetylglucosamine synthase-like glycosyltransferase
MRCLESIASQSVSPDGILVTVRTDDFESLEYLREKNLTILEIKEYGVAAALSAAVKSVSTDLIAFIDDDVTLPENWVLSAKKTFEHTKGVGALGGTDRQLNVIHRKDVRVGEMTAYGKLIGNHHLATGPTRNVDFLKGCNMVMRTSIAINHSPIMNLIRGRGAQVGNDLILSISSRLEGYISIFDPEFFVFHDVAPRINASKRNELSDAEKQDLVFNLVLIKLTFARKRFRGVVLLYQLLIGDFEAPGLIRSIILNQLKLKPVTDDLRRLYSVAYLTWKISKNFRQPLAARDKIRGDFVK